MVRLKHKVIVGDSRSLPELGDGSVHLVVTSPPYWNRKDYGGGKQIGFGQSYADYLGDMENVWSECLRVLVPGRRLCINIMDLFTSTPNFGRHKCVPLGADTVMLCERIGFDYMGTIVWRRIGNSEGRGGGGVLGSYPYPPNGLPKFDYEYILLFKKLGEGPEVPREVREASKLSRRDWLEYFSGVWNIQPASNRDHEATFPLELPRRLIKMFTFRGETVLDPFLGSGTTMDAARRTGRSCVGKELNGEKYLPLIREKGGFGQAAVDGEFSFELVEELGDRAAGPAQKRNDVGEGADRGRGAIDRFMSGG
jgi:site-specific DNA-methyltransferase (adenine-specific)